MSSRAGGFLVVVAGLVACAPASKKVGASEQESVSRCAAAASMERGTPFEPSRWTQGRDDWGQAASHGTAPGATGDGYRLEVREGNAYASLSLPASASLQPGTYALSFKATATRIDGTCAGSDAWVEVGLLDHAFTRDNANDARIFSRTVVDDFGSTCTRFVSYAPKLSATLEPGGVLTFVLKAGSAGNGGVAATFDDLSLTCTSGACMTCGEGGGPPAPSTGCETRGSLKACASSVTVDQDFDVRLENGRPRYETHERRPTRHEMVTLSNGKVELAFMKSAMGARLYSAKARGQELLYQNPTPRVQANWGQGGFPVFGGVESAWPVEEHGYYGNLAWEGRVAWSPNGVAFVARGAGSSVDGSAAAVTITTTLPAGSEAWTQRVELTGNAGAENMYYTNIMIDGGSKEQPADLEVIIPGMSRAQVHSRGDQDGWLPEAGGEFAWPVHQGRDVSRMNTTVASWLGMFAPSGAARVKRYGTFDHGRRHGLAVLAADTTGFYPKFFCGRGITADASGSNKAYCEMWFSPNARTFWDHPKLTGPTLVHEVKIVPFFDRAAFDTL